MADPYTVLGVQHGASRAEIKAAFRRKALAHHPDMHSTAPESVKAAHDKAFKALNEAYQSLMEDPHRYRQRASRGGFARGASAGAYAGSYGSAGASRAQYDPNYNPFQSSYRAGTGSRVWGWQQFVRRSRPDFASAMRSFSGLGRAEAAATAALGLLLAGSMLVLDPLAGGLWERNNQGKLFGSIEADAARRKQDRLEQAAAARRAAQAALAQHAAAAAAQQQQEAPPQAAAAASSLEAEQSAASSSAAAVAAGTDPSSSTSQQQSNANSSSVSSSAALPAAAMAPAAAAAAAAAPPTPPQPLPALEAAEGAGT